MSSSLWIVSTIARDRIDWVRADRRYGTDNPQWVTDTLAEMTRDDLMVTVVTRLTGAASDSKVAEVVTGQQWLDWAGRLGGQHEDAP